MPPLIDHRDIDEANEAADLLIARRLRRDPALLREARRNLRRWMARDGKRPRPVFLEWALVLDKLTRSEIAAFLESDTPKARRLRQSSPFMSLLTSREAAVIQRKLHAKARN